MQAMGPSCTPDPVGIVPLLDNVLIEEIPRTEQHVGNIVIPITAKTSEGRLTKLGRVLTRGPGNFHPDNGRWLVPPVEPEDIVVYLEFGSSIIQHAGKTYTLISADGILARLTKGT
jgi:co-chaperonin GroES (HSP10)